jgi:hypothetical protein
MSDIGAIEPGSWQDWHFAWKIGATSFENVTVRSAARAVPAAATQSVPADGEGSISADSRHLPAPFRKRLTQQIVADRPRRSSAL